MPDITCQPTRKTAVPYITEVTGQAKLLAVIPSAYKEHCVDEPRPAPWPASVFRLLLFNLSTLLGDPYGNFSCPGFNLMVRVPSGAVLE